MHNINEGETMGVSMKRDQLTAKRQFAIKATAAAVMAACASSAMAWEYSTDGGWDISVSTTVSASAAWRVEERDKSLISADDALAAGLAPPVAGSYNSAAAIIGARALGYLGGSKTDAASLNYDTGDRYQTLFKFITDLEFKKGDTGGLIRVKGWYDQALNDEVVPFGHQNTAFAGAIGSASATTALPARPYSDENFAPLNRFDGLYLLDAYAYTSFDLGDSPMQVRVGRQAVNWGESVFIQGVNQLAPLDISALRRAGTEIKEALLPVWALTANVGLGNGMSLDAYYQLKWEPTNVDSCGTYWAPAESRVGTYGARYGAAANQRGCSMATALLGSSPAYYNGFTALQPFGVGTAEQGVESFAEPKNGGQWGLSFRFPVEAIDTEFGIYAMNIHSRVPVVNTRTATTAQITALAPIILGVGNLPNGVPAAAVPAANNTRVSVATLTLAGQVGAAGGGWTYPEDIKIFGISAATTIMDISVGLELSHQQDVPVQVNGSDLLNSAVGYGTGRLLQTAGAIATAGGNAAVGGATTAAGTAALANNGPLTARFLAAGDGAFVRGYDLFDKTQLQINGVGSLPGILGATNGLVIAEAAAQWNNIPAAGLGAQPRYGKAFILGVGQTNSYGPTSPFAVGCAAAIGTNVGNPQPQGCGTEGYVTDFSWGYRVRLSLDYPAFLGSSFVFTPSIFWAHDVDGVSMDGQLNEGKKTISLGAKFNLNKAHDLQFTYTTYSNSAKYDLFRDKDNASISYTYSF
jgi:Protein of unknown function (DUF1302)